ncbi:MAG TPA: MBOAT family O-acyltransferase, partial [Candidatus Polarisedimenticolia bacterium]|nr:MBOAT family O-acyltransferase [Candidatus Polarisedimenticolia bacterium]
EIEFLFFLPPLFALYWLGPKRVGWQNGCLLFAGILFYAGWDWRFLPLLWGGAAVDFVLARWLADTPDDPAHAGRRRLALGLSLALSLGALAWFKYLGFFAQSMGALLNALGLAASLPILRVALPLGISFWTLQRIGYMVDVYYGRIPACRSFWQFALFVTWFPQVTAGPISRGAQLLPQLERPRLLSAQGLATAAGTFLLGYFLKGCVADWLGARVVDPVFDEEAIYSAATHWIALLSYAVQVFADFAGYSLLAIGASRAFGLELPMNFNAPFLSKSLAEFWGRWHITLNRWLFDYIYGPLTTGKGWFRGKLDAGLLLVFLASGIWHGAAWGFILWGILHGLGMVAHRNWDEFYRGLCRRDRAWVARRRTWLYGALAWALTQGFFVLALLPFRAVSGARTLDFAAGLLGHAGSRGLEMGVTIVAISWIGVFAVALLHLVELPGWGLRERLRRVPAPVTGVAFGLLVLWIAVMMPASSGTFIYRAF